MAGIDSNTKGWEALLNKEMTTVSNASENFDNQLERYLSGELPEDYIYMLGRPGEILRSTGFPDREIQMSASRLAEKARDPKHPYDLRQVKGLVNALNNPIAVFKYKNIDSGRNIILHLETEGKKFLAGVHIDKEDKVTSVTDIRNLFAKDTPKWINWIQQGKSLYLNKEEIQGIIAEQRTNHAEVSYVDLDFVAKIVEKFENPKFSDKKMQSLDEYFNEEIETEVQKTVSDNFERIMKESEEQTHTNILKR